MIVMHVTSNISVLSYHLRHLSRHHLLSRDLISVTRSVHLYLVSPYIEMHVKSNTSTLSCHSCGAFISPPPVAVLVQHANVHIMKCVLITITDCTAHVAVMALFMYQTFSINVNIYSSIIKMVTIFLII